MVVPRALFAVILLTSYALAAACLFGGCGDGSRGPTSPDAGADGGSEDAAGDSLDDGAPDAGHDGTTVTDAGTEADGSTDTDASTSPCEGIDAPEHATTFDEWECYLLNQYRVGVDPVFPGTGPRDLIVASVEVQDTPLSKEPTSCEGRDWGYVYPRLRFRSGAHLGQLHACKGSAELHKFEYDDSLPLLATSIGGGISDPTEPTYTRPARMSSLEVALVSWRGFLYVLLADPLSGEMESCERTVGDQRMWAEPGTLDGARCEVDLFTFERLASGAIQVRALGETLGEAPTVEAALPEAW